MVVGGVLEFILGNTFPSVVFSTFGAFWLAFGGTLQPFYGVNEFYATSSNEAFAKTLESPAFAETFAFFLVYMGVLCFVYLIASIRTSKFLFSAHLFAQRLTLRRCDLLHDLLVPCAGFRMPRCRFLWDRERESKCHDLPTRWSCACLGGLSTRLVPLRCTDIRRSGPSARWMASSRRPQYSHQRCFGNPETEAG